MVRYVLDVGYLGHTIPVKSEPVKTIEQIIKILKLKGKVKIKFECPEYKEVNKIKDILTGYKFKDFLADLIWFEVRKLIENLLDLNESLKKRKYFLHFFLTLTWPNIEIETVDCEFYFSLKASLEILNKLKCELVKD